MLIHQGGDAIVTPFYVPYLMSEKIFDVNGK
jgi:hypothetical protein